MNTRILRLHYPGLALVLLLSACSGGNIDVTVEGPIVPTIPAIPTSEAVTAQGTITALSDVTVNGVDFTANGATVTINGQPGTASDLRLGQIVTVTGRIDSLGRSGTAERIRFDANLVGPVESVDPPGNQLIVMGQSVRRDPDTQLGAGIDPATLAGLSAGSIVQISGYRDAAGAIRATRIDPAPAGAELQIIGDVTGLDLANLLFMVNRLTIDYSGAVFIDLPGGAPANGMTVKAFGTMSGGLFSVERLVTAPALDGNTDQRVQIGGVITRFRSPADFDINGYAASVNAATVFVNGDDGNLALNAEIVIDGDFASGNRITANRLTFGRLTSNTATLTFGLRDFTEISVPTVFNVTITQGPDFSVSVTVDEFVQDRVEVTQTGSRLNIALLPGSGNIDTLDALVTMPVLDRIDLTGVVNARLHDFNQAQMTVNVGGVSRLQGNGLTIGDLAANVSGVSHLDFGAIPPVAEASINISGVSQATLNMDVGATLVGSVGSGQGTGVSTLFYYGTNVDLDVATDGLSSVVRLGGTRSLF